MCIFFFFKNYKNVVSLFCGGNLKLVGIGFVEIYSKICGRMFECYIIFDMVWYIYK